MILPNDPPNLSWQSPIVSNIPWVESTPPLYENVRACVLSLFSSPIPLDLGQAPGPSRPTHIQTHIHPHYHCIGDLFQVVIHYGTCGTLYRSMVVYCTTRTTQEVKGVPGLLGYWKSSSTSWSDDMECSPIPLSSENNVCTTQKFFPKTYLRIFLVTK